LTPRFGYGYFLLLFSSGLLSQIFIVKIASQPVPEESKDKSSWGINRVTRAFKMEYHVEKNKVKEQKN